MEEVSSINEVLLSQIYLHVDFPKTQFSEAAIRELEETHALARFSIKDVRTGKQLQASTLSLWPRHDVTEL